MEKYQKDHIKSNLVQLLELTNCGDVVFIAHFESTGKLGAGDVSKLNGIPDGIEKTREFYRMLTTKADSYDILCHALQDTTQTGALHILQSIPSKSNTREAAAGAATNKSIKFDVLPPVPLFTGRKTEISNLHQQLAQSNSSTVVVAQKASVTGLGGVGKTELCRKYVESYSKLYDDNVIWINAEDPLSLSASFQRLAKDYLEIPTFNKDGSKKDIKTVVEEIYNVFHARKCLFIFDNVVKRDSEELEMSMPKRVKSGPYVLITSRERMWNFDASVLVLDEMTEQDAVLLVQTGLVPIKSHHHKDENIKKLVNRLQRLPLTLQQAISYIQQQNIVRKYDIDNYLKALEETSIKIDLLGSKISPLSLSNSYTETTLTTWKTTTDFIKTNESYGKLAIHFLYVMTYLKPDKISSELLTKCATTEEKLYSALQLLVKFSMINSQPADYTFSIHRLVQEVTRIELQRNEKEINVLKNCLQMFEKNISGTFIVHAVSAYHFASQYENIVTDFSQLPARLLNLLRSAERYMEAESFGRSALAALAKFLPCTHMSIMRTKFHLAVVDLYLRGPEQGLHSLQNLYAEYKTLNTSPEFEFDKSRVLLYIAKANMLLGKENETVSILEEDFQKIQLSEDDSEEVVIQQIKDILETINCVASTFDDCEDSKTFLEAELEFYKSGMGIGFQKKVSLIMMRLARVYQASGDDDNALQILKQAYDMSAASFEVDIELTEIGCEYARVLCKQESYPISEAVICKVYDCRVQVLGKFHISTLNCLYQRGEIKQQMGSHEEAAKTFQIVIDILSKMKEDEPIVQRDVNQIHGTFMQPKCRQSIPGTINKFFGNFLRPIFPSIDIGDADPEEPKRWTNA